MEHILPKISIILPVYNVEAWISETIISIQAQTFQAWEAIFVIDGSSDQSESIIKNISQGDERIITVSQENQGTGAARNTGVRLAQGEYLFFLDPDDLLPLDALEKAYETAAKHGVDIVIGEYKTFIDTKNYKPVPAQLPPNPNFTKLPEIFQRQDIPDSYFYTTIYFCSPCMQLFKSAIWKKHKINFTEKTTLGEDFVAVREFYLLAKKICAINTVFLYYRKREGSATNKQTKSAFDIFYVYNHSEEIYKKHHLPLKEQTLMRADFLKLFYEYLLLYTPIRYWINFHKNIHSAVSNFKTKNLSLLDSKNSFSVFLLSQKNIFFLIPFSVIAFFINIKINLIIIRSLYIMNKFMPKFIINKIIYLLQFLKNKIQSQQKKGTIEKIIHYLS